MEEKVKKKYPEWIYKILFPVIASVLTLIIASYANKTKSDVARETTQDLNLNTLTEVSVKLTENQNELIKSVLDNKEAIKETVNYLDERDAPESKPKTLKQRIEEKRNI